MNSLFLLAASFVFGVSGPQENLWASSVRHEPADGVFVGGYSIDHSGLWITEFYSRQVGQPGAPPAYFARRALSTAAGLEQIRWAASDSCAALEDVLGGLNDLPAVTVRVTGLSAYSSLSPRGQLTMDGASYSVWGSGRQADGSLVSLTMTSGGGAIATFVAAADRHMADCWKDARD